MIRLSIYEVAVAGWSRKSKLLLRNSILCFALQFSCSVTLIRCLLADISEFNLHKPSKCGKNKFENRQSDNFAEKCEEKL